jgi:hypothetical protein
MIKVKDVLKKKGVQLIGPARPASSSPGPIQR